MINFLIGIACYAFIQSGNADPLTSKNGIEVKGPEPDFYEYLSDLNLTEKDLSWGNPEQEVETAAFILSGSSLFVSIKNQSPVPIIIPVAGDLPWLVLNSSVDSPRKHIGNFDPAFNGQVGGEIKLKPGQMTTFKLGQRIQFFNKEHIPMIISVKLFGVNADGKANLNDEFYSESKEVKYSH